MTGIDGLLSEYKDRWPLWGDYRPMLGYRSYTDASEFEFTLVIDTSRPAVFMRHKPCGTWVAENHQCHTCTQGCCAQ